MQTNRKRQIGSEVDRPRKERKIDRQIGNKAKTYRQP
jgi:hypothetical protein